MPKQSPFEEQFHKHQMDTLPKIKIDLPKTYNEPEHYHKHTIDTIQFLQEGFPPDVFTHFAIGHVIKYLQRYQYKNGKEDLMKAYDYCKRLVDWYEKNHS